jgi:hypothetical protein
MGPLPVPESESIITVTTLRVPEPAGVNEVLTPRVTPRPRPTTLFLQ